MLKSIINSGSLLGAVVIASIVILKYYHIPKLFLLIVILASFFYQKATNRKYNKKYNLEETLINISKFIIITGILGYIIIRIIGIFFPVLFE